MREGGHPRRLLHEDAAQRQVLVRHAQKRKAAPSTLPSHDNMWCMDPQRTIEFMAACDKPWIAYKVLAAGVHPTDGLKYAFENGADFACVGMLDFQVREDAIIANLLKNLNRPRPWRA